MKKMIKNFVLLCSLVLFIPITYSQASSVSSLEAPRILYININTLKKKQVMSRGKAGKNSKVQIVFLHNSNKKFVVNTKANQYGIWTIYGGDIKTKFLDGLYTMKVSYTTSSNKRSQVVTKTQLNRYITIPSSIKLNDGKSKRLSDNMINRYELKSLYISGKVAFGSIIKSIYIYNEKYPSKKYSIQTSRIKINNQDRTFRIGNAQIPFNGLKDGKIVLKLLLSNRDRKIISRVSIVYKDTQAPLPPKVINKIKAENMAYAKSNNIIVFDGTAEPSSIIKAKIYNEKYKNKFIIVKVKTAKNGHWQILGKDVNIDKIKTGKIETLFTQFDKAGNQSKSIKIKTHKKDVYLFDKNNKIIPAEDYMPVYTIDSVNDKIKSIVVDDQNIIAGSYEFLYFFDKLTGKLNKKIEIKKQWVNSIVIYQNNIIIALDGGNIQIRDKSTGKLFKNISTSKNGVSILKLAVDQKTNRLISSSTNGDVFIYDLKTYKKLYTLNKHQWDVASLAIKGDTLYTGSDDHSIKMWSLKTGKLLKNIKSAHNGAINAILIYKNLLISGSDDKLIYIRDLRTGKLMHILKGHRKGITALKINHDILVSTSKDRSLILWNINTFEKLKQLKGHNKSILCMDINNENIVTGSMDYKIRVWGYDESLIGDNGVDESTLAKYALIKSLKLSNNTITALGQTENEIVFSTKGYIYFYNNMTYKFVKKYTTLDKVFANVKKGKKSKDSADGEDDWGDSEEKSTNDSDGWTTQNDDDEDTKPGWEEKIELKEQLREKRAMSTLQWINDISIDGTKLIAALGYKNLKIWDIERNRAVVLVEAHDNSVLSITALDDSYITSSASGVVKIWSNEEDEALTTIEAHQWDVRTTAVDDGKLYTGSDDYSIKIWDMESGDLIKVIKSAHYGRITKIIISDKYIISSSTDGTIKFRDKIDGKLVKTLIGHKKAVNTMVADENFLISGSDDATIKVWDINNGDLVSTLKAGHKKGVTALMLTDDYIISGGKDKKISVWKYYE